jgi:hypothetical protein
MSIQTFTFYVAYGERAQEVVERRVRSDSIQSIYRNEPATCDHGGYSEEKSHEAEKAKKGNGVKTDPVQEVFFVGPEDWRNPTPERR